jgi:hypothetical protein
MLYGCLVTAHWSHPAPTPHRLLRLVFFIWSCMSMRSLYQLRSVSPLFAPIGDQKFIISSSSVLRKARKALVLHLQSLASTNSHWARVVGYGPFIIIISPSQSTAGHTLLQVLAISLDPRRLASSSCQPSCASGHSTWHTYIHTVWPVLPYV